LARTIAGPFIELSELKIIQPASDAEKIAGSSQVLRIESASAVWRLQRFPVILDHSVIQYDREAP
jgi:hypothetical protein